MTLPLDLPLTIEQQPHTPSIIFTVHGEPIPQGSAKAFVHPHTNRAIVTSDNPRTRPWRALVDDAARQVTSEPLTGPVAVTIRFTLARPKSRPRRDLFPDRRPDIDKLARAILDAITGAVVVDDAQVVQLACRKDYVGHPRALAEPGCVIEVQAVAS